MKTITIKDTRGLKEQMREKKGIKIDDKERPQGCEFGDILEAEFGKKKEKDRFPGITNEWTGRVEKDAGEISALKLMVAYNANLFDAMQNALAAREKIIEDIIKNLEEEKSANLRWEEFAHNAIAEMQRYRELLIAAGMDPEEIKKKISQGKEI